MRVTTAYESNTNLTPQQAAMQILHHKEELLRVQIKNGVVPAEVDEYDLTLNVVQTSSKRIRVGVEEKPVAVLVQTFVDGASLLFWPEDDPALLVAFLPLGSRDVAADPRPYSAIRSREVEALLRKAWGSEKEVDELVAVFADKPAHELAQLARDNDLVNVDGHRKNYRIPIILRSYEPLSAVTPVPPELPGLLRRG